MEQRSLTYAYDERRYKNLDSLRWFSQRRSRTPYFWGCAPRGAMTPKFELGRYFCTMHLYPEVSSSYVYSFGSYRVDKHTHPQTNTQTNVQTDTAENSQRCSLRYDVG